MIILDKFVSDNKLHDCLICLYSGYYDSDDLREFIVDANFLYITGLNIPNLFILYNSQNKNLYFIFDDMDDWADNDDFIQIIYDKYGNNIKIYKIDKFNEIIENNEVPIYTINTIDFILHKADNILMNKYITKLRAIKNNEEINKIYIANKYTSMAIKHVFQNLLIKNYKYCYQIVNNIKCKLGYYNIIQQAYTPICTVGTKNNILHSQSHIGKLLDGNLVLLDIGCRYNGYCADISRTFPVNGRFTQLQKNIYNIVLLMQNMAFELIGNNIKWNYVQDSCLILLYIKLIEYKILKNRNNTREDKLQIASLFMPHSLGHSVGIDVHDPLNLHVLKTNMVLAIEPGIYFYKTQLNHNSVNKPIWNDYMSIGGIRIEDVVVVKDIGVYNLTNLEKTIEEIEDLMNK